MLKIYGPARSRSSRALWMAEECGVPYEHEDLTSYPTMDAKSAAVREVNPIGKIPVITDGDFTLSESMAINLYLAKRYGGSLYPANPADEARAWQWSVWAISEVEPLQMQIVIQTLFTPEEKKNPKVIPGATKGLQRPLKVLDAALAGRDWLLGEAFSVADLNVASVMYLMRMIRFDYSGFANVQRWANACYARPALARALARP